MLCCGDICGNEVGDVQDHTRFKRRDRCTDCGFLCVFILFIIGLIFICSYAFAIGSPLRMIHGSDSFGNICGYRNSHIEGLQFSGLDMRKRPYLYHLNQHKPKGSVKICVRKCPKQLLTNMADVYGFYTKTNSSLCRYDFDFSNAGALSNPYYLAHNRVRPTSAPSAHDSIYGFEHRSNFDDQSLTLPTKPEANETGLCPTLPVLKTKTLLYHCVPEIAITQGLAMGHSLYDFTSSYVPLKKIISDVMNARDEMIIMASVAIVASFVSAFVIHFVAALASWLILIVISILLLIVSGLLWWAYFDFKYDWQTFKLHKVFLPEDSENESILLGICIISTVVTLVIIYAAAILRQHVKFVVALFHETAKCIRSMPMLLIQPVWTLASLLLFLYFWLLAMMALSNSNNSRQESRLLQSNQTTNENEVLKVTQLASFTLIRYKELNWIHYFWWYLLIALVWVSEFILSCQQVIIAGSVASWYFCRDRSKLSSPILGSVWDLFSRHLGSVALGSFLITIFKLPRLIIQQISSRLRQYPNNQVAKTLLDACSCCLYLVEKFLNYLNRNAYTVVVIDRIGFCSGAKIAFQALLSNAIRVAAINSIGDFILFLGKLAVATLTAIVGIFLVRSNPSLHYWTVPVFLMSLFAFWIAHCLLSVYEMVIDAMFLCFCRDMNLNDGTPGNDYYAPASLLKFLAEDQQEQNELRDNNDRIKDGRSDVEENPYATVT